MILLCNTRFRRKMAHSAEMFYLCFSRQQFFDTVSIWRVVCMRRGAPSCTNRYPSPSLWSGPFRVRPEFSAPAPHRRCGAEKAGAAEFRFANRHLPSHIVSIKRPQGGGRRCSISNSWSRLVARPSWRAVSTMTANVPLPVRQQAPLSPVRPETMCLSGPVSAPRAARFATTQGFAEPDLTFTRCSATGRARDPHLKAIRALPRQGGFCFFGQANAAAAQFERDIHVQ